MADETEDACVGNNADHCNNIDTETVRICCFAFFTQYASMFFKHLPLEVNESSRYISPNAQEHIVLDKQVELCHFRNVHLRHLVCKV